MEMVALLALWAAGSSHTGKRAMELARGPREVLYRVFSEWTLEGTEQCQRDQCCGENVGKEAGWAAQQGCVGEQGGAWGRRAGRGGAGRGVGEQGVGCGPRSAADAAGARTGREGWLRLRGRVEWPIFPGCGHEMMVSR